MAYIKLNEVSLVDSANEPNLLIEEDGEIKRLPVSSIATGGGAGKVITYTFNSGLLLDGMSVSRQSVLEEWNAGSILRFAISYNETSNIFNVSYQENSSGVYNVTIKYLDGEGQVKSQSV